MCLLPYPECVGGERKDILCNEVAVETITHLLAPLVAALFQEEFFVTLLCFLAQMQHHLCFVVCHYLPDTATIYHSLSNPKYHSPCSTHSAARILLHYTHTIKGSPIFRC